MARIEPELPAGYDAVRLALANVGAVSELWRACERHVDGKPEVVEDDFAASWRRPSFSLAEDAVAVRRGEELVAYAARAHPHDADVCVAPEHEGRGLGSALMRWTWAIARARGDDRVGQSISENAHAASALLRAHGYEHRWTAWILELEHAAAPEPPVLPAGFAVRDFAPGRDDRAAYRVIEDAFSEWRDREPEPFEDWAAEALERPGFEPSHLALVTHGADVVGAAILVPDGGELWVDQLAVARACRGLGLGRALLAHGFGVTWASGLRTTVLATDTRTGALGLYQHVGMSIRREYAHLVRPL